MKPFTLSIMMITLLALQGCSITGLSGKSEFSCNLPGEQGCKNLDQVYAMTKEDRSTTKEVGANSADAPEDTKVLPMRKAMPASNLQPDTPIYLPPSVQRVWMAPFEDSDGVLHDQSYRYLVVNTGGWQVAHTKANVKKANRGPLMDMIPTVGKEASER